MGDTRSAELFGDFFQMLAQNPSDEHKVMARKLLKKQNEYDFCLDEMGAEKSLRKLGIKVYGYDDPEYETSSTGWLDLDEKRK